MKKIGILFAVLIVIFIMATFGTAEDKAWFDMENCDFCANMSKDMMDHMTHEQHRISNGVMVLATFPPEYKEEFGKAMAAMEQLGMDMGTGKVDVTTVKTCGHCDYYGMMMQKGAKLEHVSSDLAEIDLITSDNAEVVKMIMTYADNNDKAMAEIMEMMKHEGHDH